MDKQELKQAKQKYVVHKVGAQMRGIDFCFSFNEWLQFWLDSKHWYERGNKKGQYCMSRYNDEGPYRADNVFIQLHGENSRQAHTGKIGPNLGKPMSDAAKQKLSKINKARTTPNGMLGKIHSEETKRKISLAQKNRLAKKLQEVA